MSVVGLHTKSHMIVQNCNCEDAEDVIHMLSELAHKEGYVTEEFFGAILEREKSYPTGLPTEVPIAMPHVHDGCNRTFFAMATLNSPISFRCMGDPDTILDVRHVFLFGITDPSQQTEVLRKFSMAFRDSEFLNACTAVGEQTQLLELIKEKLSDCLIFED